MPDWTMDDRVEVPGCIESAEHCDDPLCDEHRCLAKTGGGRFQCTARMGHNGKHCNGMLRWSSEPQARTPAVDPAGAVLSQPSKETP